MKYAATQGAVAPPTWADVLIRACAGPRRPGPGGAPHRQGVAARTTAAPGAGVYAASTAFTMSSTTFLASPNTIIVLSM